MSSNKSNEEQQCVQWWMPEFNWLKVRVFVVVPLMFTCFTEDGVDWARLDG